MSEEGTVSLVLFSGTDDRLQSAAVLAGGRGAMGRKVNLFLQYWALDAFRADRILKDHGHLPRGRGGGRRGDVAQEQDALERAASAGEGSG